eukprot:m.164607 g.164607  ORF g.164607 m.164607 type:complete len:477 (+) comp13426_c1_seq12:1682-3112(+)
MPRRKNINQSTSSLNNKRRTTRSLSPAQPTSYSHNASFRKAIPRAFTSCSSSSYSTATYDEVDVDDFESLVADAEKGIQRTQEKHHRDEIEIEDEDMDIKLEHIDDDTLLQPVECSGNNTNYSLEYNNVLPPFEKKRRPSPLRLNVTTLPQHQGEAEVAHNSELVMPTHATKARTQLLPASHPIPKPRNMAITPPLPSSPPPPPPQTPPPENAVTLKAPIPKPRHRRASKEDCGGTAKRQQPNPSTYTIRPLYPAPPPPKPTVSRPAPLPPTQQRNDNTSSSDVNNIVASEETRRQEVLRPAPLPPSQPRNGNIVIGSQSLAKTVTPELCNTGTFSRRMSMRSSAKRAVEPQKGKSARRKRSPQERMMARKQRLSSGFAPAVPNRSSSIRRRRPKKTSKKMAPKPAVVCEDFIATHPNEMSVKKGEVVTVLKLSEEKMGWLVGKIGKNRRGLFPSTCCNMVQDATNRRKSKTADRS